MHRPKEIISHKETVVVRFKFRDSNFTGTLFVGGQERVLDLLNGPGRFLPIQIESKVNMFNKDFIEWMVPDDVQRMGDEIDDG